MLTGEEAAALVAPLIEGLVEDPPWRRFLDALRERAEADYAGLVCQPLPSGTPGERVIGLHSGEALLRPPTQHRGEDIHLRIPMPWQEMAEGRVHSLHELLQLDEAKHDAYLADLLMPSGMNHIRMIRFAERGGASGWITIARRDRDFPAGADRLLADLAPYLRRALAGFVSLERERMAASLAKEAVRQMSFGWVALDADGRVLGSDVYGTQVLAGSGMLMQGEDGRLTVRDPVLRRQVHMAVGEFANNRRARPRAIVLCREPWLDLLLVASGQRMGMTRSAPAMICYVHADNWTSADRCEQLARLYDLAPGEARLALALSRGMSISEAAPELGLTIESARTYSKRIYAKTGARGQADLIRYIHRSVLVIA
ncbi:MAG TPA: helix-turn-helix transcriptional regulator [Novosphingobium sp.]|nr:helix-turn-helix transcriptional regulator [Novosphingobium sp.]